jgi:hypothetical protein
MRKIILASLVMLFYTTAAFCGIYNDNGDGTVTDLTTKLTWQQCSEGQSDASCATGTAGTYTWQLAINYCEGLTLGGYADWRLPNFRELQSLTDMTTYNPAINIHYFPATQQSTYWSSTTYMDDTTCAWVVYFGNGMTYGSAVNNTTKTNAKYVRCVRGRSLGSFVRLMRGSNPVHTYSTFHDAYAAALGGDTIQAQAVASAENLVLASSSDINVWLRGGYDNGFNANSGFTTFGSLTISHGLVTIEHVKIK